MILCTKIKLKMTKLLKTFGIKSYRELIGKTMVVSFTEDKENRYEIYFRINYFAKWSDVIEFEYVDASVARDAVLQVGLFGDNDFYIVIIDKDNNEYGYYETTKKRKNSSRITNGKIKIID